MQQCNEYKKLQEIMDATDAYIHKDKPLYKTKACQNRNCNRPNCDFAHSLEEFRIVKCTNEKRYPKCTTPNCTFFHKSESRASYLKRMKINLPEVRIYIPERSQPCKFVLENKPCCNFDCTFAHTEDELSPNKCAFGNECNNDECKFKHPNETRKEYYDRINFVMPKFPPRVHLKSNERIIIRTMPLELEDELLELKI